MAVVNKVYDYVEEISEEQSTYLKLVPQGSRVLEFGPAVGYMSRYLRDKKGCRVTGFEYSPEAAQISAQYCEQMVVGDIEDTTLWHDLKAPYDVILFADVLEHLRYPENVMARCKALLAPDGCILISIPNIAHWSVRMNLMQGRFDYTETGLLDNTHIRFFTRKTLEAMVEQAGYSVVDWDASRSYPPYKGWRLGPVRRLMNKALDRLMPNASVFQFFICCRLKTGQK